jgi:hypothetical protein
MNTKDAIQLAQMLNVANIHACRVPHGKTEKAKDEMFALAQKALKAAFEFAIQRKATEKELEALGL